jgi:hypothetical protein
MAATNQFTPRSGSRRGSGSVRTDETDSLDPGRIIENAKNMGNEVIGAVQESTTSLIDERRRRAADQIGTVADMLRNSVKPLDRKSAGTIRQYAENTARQIDDLAETLRTRSLGELADDVEDFARRWPVVFMASAVAAGFVAGRFLVSSASHPSETPAAAPQTARVTSGMTGQPRGGARYNHGAVSGPVAGSANSGYGSGRKETP